MSYYLPSFVVELGPLFLLSTEMSGVAILVDFDTAV